MNIPKNHEACRRFIDIYNESIDTANIRLPFDNFDSGTKILSSELECIQYIALYGGHHYHKLYRAYASTKFDLIAGKAIEIIDWGCGQALATCVLIDYLIEKRITLNVPSITLIEPSDIALQNGKRFIAQMFQSPPSANSIVRTVHKSIDALDSTDFKSDPNHIKIHLFSNIIDVDKFELTPLYQTITSCFRGTNRIICTSPNNQNRHRLDTFASLFSQAHLVRDFVSSDESIYGEIFHAGTNQRKEHRIGRCERQFTVELT
jgi:hypothetical protein